MIDPVQVKGQLAKICNSPQFRTSSRLRDFLQFIVRETLVGNAQSIKEYSIGTLVYSRGALFEPKIDSIVRVDAIKLRRRLTTYYAQEGSADQLVIHVPKGGYIPEFHNRGTPHIGDS